MLDETVDVPGIVTTIVSRTAVNVINPQPEMIDVRDIARALSNQCRYMGHVEPKRFYSTAEHCFHVSVLCGDDPVTALWGLHHDDSEFVLSDICSTIKYLPEMSAYRVLERRMMAAVCQRFDLPLREPAIVKEMDLKIRIAERCIVRGRSRRDDDPIVPVSIWCWDPPQAEKMFLQRHYELVEARKQRGDVNERSALQSVS